jgi:hypothetical protein
VEIYNTIRSEIITNHILMHFFSIVAVVILLLGVWITETRKTILSVFIPLISIAWAATMVRFDFFIHRQTSYLRFIETQLAVENNNMPLWETWRLNLRSTQIVVPIADIIAFSVILIPTVYLLFGPSRQFFEAKDWKGASLYAWSLICVLLILICCLAFIPRIAQL